MVSSDSELANTVDTAVVFLLRTSVTRALHYTITLNNASRCHGLRLLVLNKETTYILTLLNPLTPTVAILVQLYKASCARPG